MTAQEDWPSRLTRSIASQIRHRRMARKWSAQRLSDECAALGLEIPRSTLAKLENGLRADISVAELLVIAQALEIGPAALLPATAGSGPVIEHADAVDWLAAQEPGMATAVIFDPPYGVGTPVRGREDGAAGSVSGPLSFMQRTLSLCARALRPGGIVVIFGDYKRLPDLMYAATTSGLRLSGCVAWVRTRPGTGGLFRSSWDPILIASRGTPDAVDRAAVRNVVETDDVVYANYPAKRTHPYPKPPEVLERILARVCLRGDLVLDPFAGSGSSRDAAGKLGLEWRGCDIDPAFAETTSTITTERTIA